MEMTIETFETYTDDRQAHAILEDILAQYAGVACDQEDDPTRVANLRVIDILDRYRDNLWDDQGEGGAHKDQILAVNRLFVWMGYPEMCDQHLEWAMLAADEESHELYG
jgi:hypothetical protein